MPNSSRPASLVFIWDKSAVPVSDTVGLAFQTECVILQFDGQQVAIIDLQLLMKPSSCIYRCIGNSYLLHLFKIEKSFAVCQRMKRHHPYQWIVSLIR